MSSGHQCRPENGAALQTVERTRLTVASLWFGALWFYPLLLFLDKYCFWRFRQVLGSVHYWCSLHSLLCFVGNCSIEYSNGFHHVTERDILKMYVMKSHLLCSSRDLPRLQEGFTVDTRKILERDFLRSGDPMNERT